ncbi:MAG: DNA repair protein RadA [Synergistaceae bacterium]|jgi:DNA repair protein RadA/Sms|nr:DNA repair protein RadA [Synergistaceae bacterium]
MAKAAKRSVSRYRCAECGYVSLSMVGRCPGCGAWGAMATELPLREERAGYAAPAKIEPISSVDVVPEDRISSGIEELDRVLGGGWIRGGVVLLGGEPGVGKSTLLLQACAAMAADGRRALYISGEESAGQIALRARRLGINERNVDIVCETDLPAMLEAASAYDFLVIDSVQAFRLDDENGWAGSPSQARGVAHISSEAAKRHGIPTVMVGHITKQGQIAGPKILEHMVDVVLLFSGERSSSHRLLRAEKNRYGSTDELGIFEMGEGGLEPVRDPSHLYWNRDGATVPGVSIGVALEGSRPLAAEIQALSCATPFPYPKRTARGIDTNRLQLLLAVLERRCGIFSRTSDIYVNVAGGLSLQDPAADLPICAALASSLKDVPIPPDTCLVGEVGLAGEVRPGLRTHLRIREAARLGFKNIVISAREKISVPDDLGIRVVKVFALSQMAERLIK